jgi:LuxR family maltose regulon positive regulatory protein
MSLPDCFFLIIALLGNTCVVAFARIESCRIVCWETKCKRGNHFMPKSVRSLLIWSSQQHIYVLYEQGQQCILLLQGESDAWIAWLTAHTSFSFQGLHGHLNVQKETRQRGGSYWYAYRRQGKHVAKKYVGQTTDVSPARLETIAALLAGKASPASEAGPQGKEPALRSRDREKQEDLLPVAIDPEDMLLVSKFRFPHLPAALVSRERLLARLDAASACKLTVLAAPAGFGKTTLVRQWIDTHPASDSSLPVAWVSLDAADNDPARFWRYVLTACQSWQADLGRANEVVLLATTPHSPFQPFPFEAILTGILNTFTRSHRSGLLILDEYHLITSSQIHESVTFFLDHLPPTVHVLLLTRSHPPLPLARLRANGDLCELVATDLRFSLEETQIFLQQTLASPLPMETIRQIDEYLEGWAAGLRLLVLALGRRTGQQEIEQVLATFAGSHQPLEDYFVTEVLDAQPALLQDFLLRTSLLPRLTGSLCDAVTDGCDGARLLDAIERAGLFLEPLDDARQWYRYHALWAAALRTQARHRLGEPLRHTLLQQASAWFEQHGLLKDAVETALQANAPKRAVDLMERLIEPQLFQEDQVFYVLHRWLSHVPEAVLEQHPFLCVQYAAALLFVSASSRLEKRTVTQVEALLHLAEQGWQRLGQTPRLGEVSTIRAFLTHQQGATEQAMRFAQQTLALLPPEDAMGRSLLVGILGMAELRAGQLDLARQYVLEERALSEALANPLVVRTTTGQLAAVCFEQAELHQAAELYSQMLQLSRNQEDHSDMGQALLGLAQISYEWNQVETAERQAQEALDLSLQRADTELQVRASLLLARIAHTRGATRQAHQQLSILLAHLPPSRSPLLSGTIRYWQARFQLATGDVLDEASWYANRPLHDEARPLVSYATEALLWARWLCARGEAKQALEVLARELSAARGAGRIRMTLEIQVQMALAHCACKQLHEARQRLRTVLSLASVEGYLRLFLDEGEPMEALARTLLAHLRETSLRAHLQAILRAFQEEPAHHGPAHVSPSALRVEPLSPQERRVLQLLAAGHSNSQIAAELVVSVNTIRSQVQSLYRKLDVHTRVQASEVARALQLL